MQKLAKVFSIVLLIFCSFFYIASADLSYQIPATIGGSGNDVFCTTPPYASENFGSYNVGTTGPGSQDLVHNTTSGTGICNGSFEAPGNITGNGTFYLTLYLDGSWSDPYGFIEFVCINGGDNDGDCSVGELVPDVGVFPETPDGTVASPVEFSGTYTNDGNYNRLVIFLCEVDNCTPSTTYPFFLDIGFTEATEEPYSIIEPLALGVYQSFGILLNTTNFSQSDASEWVEFTIEEDRCETLDIGCYFQRVITFLFYPSDGSLNVFKNLYQQIQTKPPFGYIFAILDEFENFDASDDSLYEIPTAEFLQEFIFDDVRIAFVWLLWFVFAVGLLKRFKLIEL